MLILAVSLLMRLLCSIYCKVNFEECKYKFYWNKSLFKEMGSFAGWNFAGSFAYSYVNEGLNIVLNLFGGVVVNAARTIAYQIKECNNHVVIQRDVGNSAAGYTTLCKG